MEYYFLIVALAMLFSGHVTDTSTALRIDISPNPYMEDSKGSAVNITCSLDEIDTDVEEISLMEIETAGGQPLVFIRHSGIQLGAGISNPSKFQIEGLFTGDIRKNYVKLSMLEPSKKDQGLYVCRMFYSGPNGILVEHRASSNLTVDVLDLNDVVRMLLGQVASLKEDLEDQTVRVDDLTEKNTNLSRKLAEKVSEITYQVDNQSLEISQIADQATYNVAFSASLSSSVTVTYGKVVNFYDVRLNQGNCYNNATGEFTAPRRGMYAFHLTLWTSCAGCEARVHIKADDAIVATLYAEDKNQWDQSSVNAILELQAGAKVKAVSRSTTNLYGNPSDDNDRRHSKFSGHLVRLL